MRMPVPAKSSKLQKIIVCFLLLPLYLMGVNSAMGLPLLSVVMAGSHNVSVSYAHGVLHLNLAHGTLGGKHEHQSGDAHEHSSSHKDHSSFTGEQQSHHTDHEVHLSSLLQHRNVATKALKTPNISTHPLITNGSIPIPLNRPAGKFFRYTSSETGPTCFYLHKIVLLI